MSVIDTVNGCSFDLNADRAIVGHYRAIAVQGSVPLDEVPGAGCAKLIISLRFSAATCIESLIHSEVV